MKYEDGTIPSYTPLWDISDPDKHHDAVFSMRFTNRSGVSVPATPLAMSEMFLPDHLLDRIAELTNKYAASRLPPVHTVQYLARGTCVTNLDSVQHSYLPTVVDSQCKLACVTFLPNRHECSPSKAQDSSVFAAICAPPRRSVAKARSNSTTDILHSCLARTNRIVIPQSVSLIVVVALRERLTREPLCCAFPKISRQVGWL